MCVNILSAWNLLLLQYNCTITTPFKHSSKAPKLLKPGIRHSWCVCRIYLPGVCEDISSASDLLVQYICTSLPFLNTCPRPHKLFVKAKSPAFVLIRQVSCVCKHLVCFRPPRAVHLYITTIDPLCEACLAPKH